MTLPPIEPDRPRTLGDIMSAAAFPALIAGIEAKHYKALVQEGVPPEHALELTKATMTSLLDNAAEILKSAKGVAEAVAPVAQSVIGLVNHPIVKEALAQR